MRQGEIRTLSVENHHDAFTVDCRHTRLLVDRVVFCDQHRRRWQNSVARCEGRSIPGSKRKGVPAEAINSMRFTFNGDTLLIRGNFNDNREETCSYKVDARKSPKHLDFTPPNEKKAVLGIYELKGDELNICVRQARSSDGRPTEFASKADSQSVMIVFTKQNP